jgi:hypothetical protein
MDNDATVALHQRPTADRANARDSCDSEEQSAHKKQIPSASNGAAGHRRAAGGFVLLDALRLLVSPGELFAHLAESNRYFQALLLLIFFHVLFGAAVLSTGSVDHEVALRNEERFGRAALSLQTSPHGESTNLAMESVRKEAAFTKVMVQLDWLVGGFLRQLLTLTATTGFLFVAVSLAGRRADLSLLMAIVTFSLYTEIVRMAVALFLIWQSKATQVDISSAVWFHGTDVGLPAYLMLRRLDPFKIWYWYLLGLGLWKTGQLSIWPACRTVLLLAVITVAGRVTFDLFSLTDLRRVVFGL